MNILTFWRKPEPTAAERLERIVRERANSMDIRNFRANRAAGKLGHARRKREGAGA